MSLLLVAEAIKRRCFLFTGYIGDGGLSFVGIAGKGAAIIVAAFRFKKITNEMI